jgi:hypothetical protein
MVDLQLDNAGAEQQTDTLAPTNAATIRNALWLQLVSWDSHLIEKKEHVAAVSLARLREHLADLVHDLIESEREACARIVEQGGTRSAIAALIRGRRP